MHFCGNIWHDWPFILGMAVTSAPTAWILFKHHVKHKHKHEDGE